MSDIQRRSADDDTVQQEVIRSLAAGGKLEPGEVLVGVIIVARTERLTVTGDRVVRRHRLHPAGHIDSDLEIGMLRRAARDVERESDSA